MISRTLCIFREVAIVEFWEHFKRFGTVESDSLICRIQCPGDTVELLNREIKMKHPLDSFIHEPPGSNVPERGWLAFSLGKTVNTNRRVMMEVLMRNGWRLVQTSTAMSDREWLVQNHLFERDFKSEKEEIRQKSQKNVAQKQGEVAGRLVFPSDSQLAKALMADTSANGEESEELW